MNPDSKNRPGRRAGSGREEYGRTAGRPGPLLFQANTRVWLTSLSSKLGRPATLDDIPDEILDRLAADGFDLLYLLGVWGSGPTSRRIAAAIPELRVEYERTLPDLTEEDICGSCFALSGYDVPHQMGGNESLARLRERLHAREMGLIVDFVPNHVGLDHPWVRKKPHFLLRGRREDLERQPGNYFALETDEGVQVVAHGRDPYFPGWTDTAQLDYGSAELQEAMRMELRGIAQRADGVRCDMAMLVVPEVFARTWGREAPAFWPAAVRDAREVNSDFLFVAEVYWGMEERLLADGFDYCYDKGMYDALRAGEALEVRRCLERDAAVQRRLVRFLENHDEERVAAALPPERHRVAAVVAFLAPGLRFIHQGQLEGARIRVPVQLCRGPDEPSDPDIAAFYRSLLPLLSLDSLSGDWRLLDAPGLEGVLVFRWRRQNQAYVGLLVAVNFSGVQVRAHIDPDLGSPPATAGSRKLQVRDLTPLGSDQEFEVSEGDLEIELLPWGYLVWAIETR